MTVLIVLDLRKACKMSLVTRVHIVYGAVDKRVICFTVKEVTHFLAIILGGGIKIKIFHGENVKRLKTVFNFK